MQSNDVAELARQRQAGRADLVGIMEVPDLEDVLVDSPYAFNQLPSLEGYVPAQVDPVFWRKDKYASGIR